MSKSSWSGLPFSHAQNGKHDWLRRCALAGPDVRFKTTSCLRRRGAHTGLRSERRGRNLTSCNLGHQSSYIHTFIWQRPARRCLNYKWAHLLIALFILLICKKLPSPLPAVRPIWSLNAQTPQSSGFWCAASWGKNGTDGPIADWPAWKKTCPEMTRQDAARDSAACRPMAVYFLRVCQLPESLAERKNSESKLKKKNPDLTR